MILYFIFFFQTQCQVIIDVEFQENNVWELKQTNLTNQLYRILNTTQSIYYIQVFLTQNDDEFQLICRENDQPIVTNNNLTDQVSDQYGTVENRSSRYIKYQTYKNSTLYCLTTAPAIQYYYFQIIVANEQEPPICPNNCSNHGNCKDNGCECEQYFIGNDCHQQANQLIENKKIIINLDPQLPIFFYYDSEDITREVTLEITTNSDKGIDIYFQKTVYLYVPKQQVYDYLDDLMVQSYSLDSKQQLEFTTQLTGITYTNNIYFFSFLALQQNKMENNITLSILFNPQSNSQLQLNTIQIIIIVVVISSVILIFIALYLACRRCNRDKAVRIRAQQYNQENQNQQSENSKLKKSKYLINENTNHPASPQFQKKESQDSEQTLPCAICLSHFKDIRMIRITPCHHFFHSLCIKVWLKQHKQCPICRGPLGIYDLRSLDYID